MSLSAIEKVAEDTITLADLAEQRLRDDIIFGVLTPDHKLRLAELKTRYAMGTSPLREGLSRLMGEGLIEFEANRGFRVAGMSREDLADITFARIAVETAALRASMQRGGDQWEADILAALHRFVRACERAFAAQRDLDAWLKPWSAAHDAFHHSLIAACGSPRMMEMQAQLALQHTRYRRLVLSHARYLDGHGSDRREPVPAGARLFDELIQEHKDLADVVLAREVAEAESMIAKHMGLTLDFYDRTLAGQSVSRGRKKGGKQ